MAAMTLCEARPWDSAFFGVSIAQVRPNRVTSEELSEAVASAARASIDCLYFLADAADDRSVQAAEEAGFSLVDVRVTLERAVPAVGAARERSVVRRAQADDLAELTSIARVSHRNTRFYRDRHFDPGRSDDMYALWIERAVKGELANVVWVVDAGERVRGYLTASSTPEGAAIGLVAVDEAVRRRGYGDELLRAAIEWAAEEGQHRIFVVTQGHSAPAIRFYERAGFTSASVQLWYHRWRVKP